MVLSKRQPDIECSILTFRSSRIETRASVNKLSGVERLSVGCSCLGTSYASSSRRSSLSLSQGQSQPFTRPHLGRLFGHSHESGVHY